MPHIEKINQWKKYLRHSISLSEKEWRLVAETRVRFDIEPELKSEVFTWLEENIGYVKETPWHKDPWHPAKPAFHFEATLFQSRFFQRWYCTMRFYRQEDAMAFKLRWL